MSSGYVRRFLSDPSLAELLAIEGVVIIDRDPPASINGAGSGVALCVGEFEDGPFGTPTQVASGADLLATFGGFGFTYAGVIANNPCARKRLADGATVPEYWNGSGFIALINKAFGGLVVQRVDTSVGSVEFTREAYLLGTSDTSYALVTGQTLKVDIGAGNVTATFTGTKAAKQGADGTYPSTFSGGEYIDFLIEGTTYRATFLSGDQTHVEVLARLNAAAGYTAFTAQTLKTTLTGTVGGTDGTVQIVAVSAGLVTTATGFSAGAAVFGAGNVGNIAAVTDAEADTVIGGAVTGTAVDRDVDGFLRLVNTGEPGTGTIEVDSTSTATAFGFPTETLNDAAVGVDGVIPAGTRIRNVGGDEWVTMQTLAISATAVDGTTASGAGPYTVKVRPGLDDGTLGGANADTVTTLPFALAAGPFAVNNPLPLVAALSESAIDALYVAAIDKTKSTNNVSKIVNLSFSARQSNIIRRQMRQNVIDASGGGCQGRVACIRPPLKTTRAVARGDAQPGVGAYRDQRVIYSFPGAQTYVPSIATRGTAGGAGFTASGLVDVGADSWAASVCSQLPPEENPGQATTFLLGVTAIEAGNSDVQDLTLGDYELFKSSGIMALRIDGGETFFQSGITSVDPVLYPQRVTVARRRMADYIEDSLAGGVAQYVKQLATLARRALILGEIDGFLAGLKSEGNPTLQRIDSYRIDGKTGNTPDSLAKGIFRVIVKVRTLSSLDVIVLDCEIGTTVNITQTA